MASCKRCDRCHKYFPDDRKIVSVMQFRESKSINSKALVSLDVCSDCKALILALFKPAPDECANSINIK